MKLFLVTINFNRADKTLQLLQSLRVQQDNDFDVYVIDNASEHNDLRILEAGLIGMPPTFHLIKSKENRGFSGGNNIGIRVAMEQEAEWTLLINNDTTVAKDFISSIKRYLASTSSKLVGIPLQEGSRIAYAGIVSWLTATMRHVYDFSDMKDRRIYSIGGGVAMHRELIENVGLWDERYFLYFEDADFSERARRKGYIPAVASDVSIVHDVSSTTQSLGSPILLRYHHRNALLFNGFYAPVWAKILLPIWSLFVILKQVIKIVFLPKKRLESHAILRGTLDFWNRKFGKIT